MEKEILEYGFKTDCNNNLQLEIKNNYSINLPRSLRRQIDDIANFFGNTLKIRDKKLETFYCCLFDEDFIFNSFMCFGIGEKNKMDINYAKVITFILMTPYKNFLLLHNHPNDSIAPSQKDLNLNETAKKTVEEFKFCFIDHIIISPSRYILTEEHNIQGGNIYEWKN